MVVIQNEDIRSEIQNRSKTARNRNRNAPI